MQRMRTTGTFKEATAHIGFKIEKSIYMKLSDLAQKHGVSISFAIRRAIIDLLNSGTIGMGLAPNNEDTTLVDERTKREEIEKIHLTLDQLQKQLGQITQPTEARPVADFQQHREERKQRRVNRSPLQADLA